MRLLQLLWLVRISISLKKKTKNHQGDGPDIDLCRAIAQSHVPGPGIGIRGRGQGKSPGIEQTAQIENRTDWSERNGTENAVREIEWDHGGISHLAEGKLLF